MARGLVCKNIDLFVVVNGVLQQIHNISVVGNRHRLALGNIAARQLECFFWCFRAQRDPAKALAKCDFRLIYLSNNANAIAHFDRLSLSAAHAAKTGRDEKRSLHHILAVRVVQY